jgi:hypothetical protein
MRIKSGFTLVSGDKWHGAGMPKRLQEARLRTSAWSMRSIECLRHDIRAAGAGLTVGKAQSVGIHHDRKRKLGSFPLQ